MADTVPVDGLTAKISAILTEYTDAVIDGVKQDVKAVAQECKAGIERDAPRKSGRYAGSWKIKYEETPLQETATVYSKEGWLTHLLENGHARRGGGRTRAFPHIKPNEEKANAELGKRIEQRIANGR